MLNLDKVVVDEAPKYAHSVQSHWVGEMSSAIRAEAAAALIWVRHGCQCATFAFPSVQKSQNLPSMQYPL